MLDRNDAKLFLYAEDIEKTVKSLRYHKQELKNAVSEFFKQYHSECIDFERNKYFSDLSFFEAMSGNTNWRQYI